MYTTAHMMYMYFWLNICAHWCTYVVHTTNISYICAIHVTWGNYTFFTYLFLWEIYFKSCAYTSTYDAHLWWISLQKLNDNHTKSALGMKMLPLLTYLWPPYIHIYFQLCYKYFLGITFILQYINLLLFYNCIQVV